MSKNTQFFSSLCLIGKSFANSPVKQPSSLAGHYGIGRWIIARHGQSEFNINNFWAGWHDTKLTPKGELQDETLGAILKEKQIFPDIVITTDLSRATKTTQIVLKTLGSGNQDFEIDRSLRELHPGALIGRQKDDINKQFVRKWVERPEAMTSAHSYHPSNNSDTLGMPENGLGAESMQDVAERSQALLQRVIELIKNGKTVLTVDHNNSISAMISNISKEKKKIPLKNAAPYEGLFEVKDGELTFLSLMEMTQNPLQDFAAASFQREIPTPSPNAPNAGLILPPAPDFGPKKR